jgi:hypothetical protein
MAILLHISNIKQETADYVTINIYNTLNNEWISSFELRSPIIELRGKIEPNVERYHCEFCNYFETKRSAIEDHYQNNHEKELREIPGSQICRKVDLLITNGSKSYEDITKRYRTAPNIIELIED